MIVAGVAVDALGIAQHTQAVPDRTPLGVGFTTKRTFTSLTPDELATVQPSRIPVEVLNHGGEVVGEVLALERSGNGVWAISEVDDGLDVGGLAYSVRVTRPSADDSWTIDSVSLVGDPAMIGCRPVRVVEGLDEAAVLRLHTRDPHLAGLLERTRGRRPGAAIVIAGQPEPDDPDRPPASAGWIDYSGKPSRGPTGRSSGRVLSVR